MKRRTWQLILVPALILALITVGSPLRAQDKSDPAANKALLKAWWQVEAAHAYDRMGEFFAADIVRHSVATDAVMPETPVTNLKEYEQFLRATVAMFPDYRFVPQMLTAEDNQVAYYGTFVGTFAQNGNQIKVPMIGFARFNNGKVAELWTEWDNLTWNTQMGVIPLETGERPIEKIEDVVGVWHLYDPSWTQPPQMQLLPDGTVKVGTKECPACIKQAKYAVEGQTIHWQEPEARYAVFVTYIAGKPMRLRFVLIGTDPYVDREKSLVGKVLFPVAAVES